MKAFIKNHYHHLVLAAFLTIHGLTSAFTTLFGDDYYYAAFVKNGRQYFIDENIFHYLHTNGRALVHILDELLIGWDLWAWRIFNILCLGALAIAAAKIAARTYRSDANERKGEYRLALTIVCSILCVTDIAILRQSFYWATGMMNYLFPATLTLWFYYLFRRDFENFRGSWLLLIPAFIASATTEQASASALLVTLCFIVSSVVVKRRVPRPAYFGALITSALGFCTLYLSPGNAERTGYYPEFYELGIFERIGKNFNELTGIIFGRGGLDAAVMIEYILIALICFKYYSDGMLKPISLTLGSLTAATAGIYLWSLTSYPKLIDFWWMKALLLIPIAAALIYTAIRYFTAGEIDELYFVWCAVAMQCAMSLSPEFGPRTLTMSLAALLIPLTRRIIKHDSVCLRALLGLTAFAMLPEHITDPRLTVIIVAAVLVISIALSRLLGHEDLKQIMGCLALSICLAQFSSVAAGYYDNLPVHELNRRQIETYLAEETPPDSLVLYYLPYGQYRYTMPYDNPYHESKLLQLCGISPDIKVWYEFLPEYIYQ